MHLSETIPSRIVVPEAYWSSKLPQIIKTADTNPIIVVSSSNMLAYGQRSAAEAGRDDLIFELNGDQFDKTAPLQTFTDETTSKVRCSLSPFPTYRQS